MEHLKYLLTGIGMVALPIGGLLLFVTFPFLFLIFPILFCYGLGFMWWDDN